MNVCTICDHNYLHRGLAMYSSLQQTMPMRFTLHWLCMDDVIYEKLKRLNLSDVVLCRLSDLEDQYPELRQAKNNPPSFHAPNSYVQYCWACTPFFIWYLICVKELPDVMYADADIFFYFDPHCIFKVMGKKSVGIHTHRFTGTIDQQEKLPDGVGTKITAGWYNVGVVAFMNTPQSRGITIMWKNWLLKTDHCFYKDYGSAGDQKYLETFIALFGKDNICVFDTDGDLKTNTRIVHKAPWCTEDHQIGATEILFYHFSHFNYDLYTNIWRDHNNANEPEWRPATMNGTGVLYERYFQEIQKAEKLLNP